MALIAFISESAFSLQKVFTYFWSSFVGLHFCVLNVQCCCCSSRLINYLFISLQQFDQDIKIIRMNFAQQFDSFFKQEFDKIGSSVLAQYTPIFAAYQKHIIPFEKNRLRDSQKLVFKNSNLEKDKMELLKKLEQQISENQRLEYTLEKQSQKLNQLSRQFESLQHTNKSQEQIIQGLRKVSQNLQQSLKLKIQIIRQVQHDKEKVLKEYEILNNQNNMLLASYMKQKNMIAEKFNEMNEFEHILIEKQKELKSQKFMMQKTWQQMEQIKNQNKILRTELEKLRTEIKSGKTIELGPSIIPDRPTKKNSIFKGQIENQESKEQNKKKERHQILKNPLKKIFKHHQNQIYGISFNYHGNQIATCGGDRIVKIYDVVNLKSGTTIQSNSAQSIFTCAALNGGGQRLLTGSTDKVVQIYHSQSGKNLHSFLGHGDKVNSVVWSSARQKCISGGQDRQIKVWQIEKAANLLSISCGKAVKTVQANNVEPIVYSGHSDGSVRIYSINQGTQPVTQVRGIIDYAITSLSLVTSNRYQILAASQQGTTIHLIDLKMNKSIAKYQHKQFFNTAAKAEMSPSQDYIVAGNCDGAIYYWNRDKKTVEKRVTGHDGPVTSLKYHFLSGIMVSADNQGNLIIWQ